MIAALCSIHLIRSRNKHLDHEHALQEELTALKHSVRGAARVLPGDLEDGGPPDAGPSLSSQLCTPALEVSGSTCKRRKADHHQRAAGDGALGSALHSGESRGRRQRGTGLQTPVARLSESTRRGCRAWRRTRWAR